MDASPAAARRILGKGLALQATDPGQDIGLDVAFGPAADGGRDLATVSGVDALVQDLRVALCTGLGADALNANFGSDAFRAMADESDPVLMRERIRIAVIRVLKADPRIRRVADVRLDGEARQTAAAAGRTTELNVTAVFETALRDISTISIEGIANG